MKTVARILPMTSPKSPPEYKPHHTNKKHRAKKETGKPKTSTDQNFKQRGTAFGQGNEDFKEMGDALGRGMEQGMEQLTEGLVKAFQDMGEGLGKFIKIAEANKPDMEKTRFSSKKRRNNLQSATIFTRHVFNVPVSVHRGGFQKLF